MIMKRTGFILLIVSLLCCLPAEAQLGNLINKGKKAIDKAKEVKEKVDDEVKKANGDVDFFYLDRHLGFYRSRNGKIVLDELHKEGKRSGKNMIYTIEKNGDVIYDDGRKLGELLDGGVVNCRNEAPYLTLTASGDVVMDGEVIGNVDKDGNVLFEGMKIGKAKGIDKQVAAYIFFGILYNKQFIATERAKIKEEKLRAEQEKKRAEEARLKAAQEAEAKRMANANQAKKNNQASGKKNNSGKKVNNNTNAPKVQEWTIEKNGKSGFVDANGVVYDWAHSKIGQLPKGYGNILNGSGSIIGSIDMMGVIYDASGRELCTVHPGGYISIPGSNASVAEVHAAGSYAMSKDSRTIGTCDVRPYEWGAAIIFCDFFNF